nr:MAG TPA: hypothetical protein [Caudoviricetes sp.]
MDLQIAQTYSMLMEYSQIHSILKTTKVLYHINYSTMVVEM